MTWSLDEIQNSTYILPQDFLVEESDDFWKINNLDFIKTDEQIQKPAESNIAKEYIPNNQNILYLPSNQIKDKNSCSIEVLDSSNKRIKYMVKVSIFNE